MVLSAQGSGLRAHTVRFILFVLDLALHKKAFGIGLGTRGESFK